VKIYLLDNEDALLGMIFIEAEEEKAYKEDQLENNDSPFLPLKNLIYSRATLSSS
jgi:hypothetical protein